MRKIVIQKSVFFKVFNEISHFDKKGKNYFYYFENNKILSEKSGRTCDHVNIFYSKWDLQTYVREVRFMQQIIFSHKSSWWEV